MEALQQRLNKYKESADQAKTEGNGSKARRMGRIVKVINSQLKYPDLIELELIDTLQFL